MTNLLANPWVRLAGRAIVAGVVSGVVAYTTHQGGSIAWHAAVVAGALAFCEVFTPLNQLVGVFKQKP